MPTINKRRNLISLKRRVALIIAACSLATVIAFVQTAYQSLLSDFEHLFTRQQLLETQGAASRIEEQVRLRLHSLAGFAAMLQDDGQLKSKPELQAAIARYPGLERLFPAGLLIYNPEAVALVESISVPGRLGTSYRDRPHFQQLIQRKQPVLSRPIIGRTTGRPLLSFLAPILDEQQQLLGIAGGIIDLAGTDLTPLLSVGGRTQNVISVIDSGNFLYVFDAHTGEVNTELPPPGADALVDAVLSGITSGIIKPDDGPSMLYAASHIGDLGWIALKAEPYHDAIAPARASFFRFLAVGGLFALGITLVGMLVVRHMLKPIDDAAQRVETMATSQAGAAFLPDTRVAELRRFFDAFNTLNLIRDQQQAELTHERDRVRQQLDQSSDGILIISAENRQIMAVNQRVLELTGYGRETLRGDISELGLFTNPEAFRAMLELVALGKVQRHQLMQMVTLDARKLDVEISASRIELEDHAEIMINLRDVTERKELATLKEAFIATVSHELRTPLTAINGTLKLLDGGAIGPLPDKAHEMIGRALDNSQRLNLLINDLLDFNKIAAGRMELALEAVPVPALLAECRDVNAPLASPRQVVIHAADSPPAAVHADPLRLRQILDNLISNAIKYSPAGGTVTLAASVQEDQVTFRVSDQGDGIPTAFQPHVFDRFAQAEVGTTRAVKGTGLGLAICKDLTALMGGEIGFETEQGKGTTFWLRLPCAHCPLVSSSAAARDNG